jgi:hypothetical protein
MPDHERREPTPEEIKYVLQQAILRNYPNPERRGCPGNDAIRALAERDLPHEDRHWEHVSHCSPCYQEFLERRGVVLERRRGRRRVAVLTAAAVVLLAVAGTVFFVLRSGGQGGRQVAKQSRPAERGGGEAPANLRTAVINLESDSVVRGGDGKAGRPEQDLQRVPRGRVALLIYLPLGSEPGPYEAELRRSEVDDHPLATFSGNAELQDGLTMLRVTPDLAAIPAGTYVLAIRRAAGAWRFHRVVLA